MQVEEVEGGCNTAALLPIGRDTTVVELMVMGWFGAGHEVLWIPIIEVGPGRDGAEQARLDAEQIGEARLLRAMADLAGLPLGIKGWLFPAHLDDTCVVACREDGETMTFGSLTHPVTGRTLSYRNDTESGLLDLRRLDAATAASGQSAV